ncbi:MAG TPA: ROK family protein [Chthonomonadaceae bacterium]|nr:ROK family protein [Chthonomonadaceae bacterium]
MSYAIGVDIGGTNIKLVAVTDAGKELARMITPTEDTPEARTVWVRRIREQITQMEQAQGKPPAYIGLAAPGLAAPDGRSIAWMQGRLDAVQGLNWTEALGFVLTVPVLNDAHAALLGEAWLGAAAGCRNVILLTLGTGVGGGVLVEGQLLKGYIGRGGHLGHISLNPDGPPDIVGTPGSLEDAIGECTLSERSGGRFASTEALLAAHQAGDAQATEIWLRSVRCLAAGLVSLINVVDPEVVILGGGIARAGAALFDPLRGFLDQWEWRPLGRGVRIVPARLGEFAGAFGAAYNAFRTEV